YDAAGVQQSATDEAHLEVSLFLYIFPPACFSCSFSISLLPAPFSTDSGQQCLATFAVDRVQEHEDGRRRVEKKEHAGSSWVSQCECGNVCWTTWGRLDKHYPSSDT
ncbi:hypothetical protein KR054_009723, partial [Drosophila jambulina]